MEEMRRMQEEAADATTTKEYIYFVSFSGIARGLYKRGSFFFCRFLSFSFYERRRRHFLQHLYFIFFRLLPLLMISKYFSFC